MMEMEEDSIRLGDPIEALLALYRQPPMDKMKAPGFGRPDAATLPVAALFKRKTMDRCCDNILQVMAKVPIAKLQHQYGQSIFLV